MHCIAFQWSRKIRKKSLSSRAHLWERLVHRECHHGARDPCWPLLTNSIRLEEMYKYSSDKSTYKYVVCANKGFLQTVIYQKNHIFVSPMIFSYKCTMKGCLLPIFHPANGGTFSLGCLWYPAWLWLVSIIQSNVSKAYKTPNSPLARDYWICLGMPLKEFGWDLKLVDRCCGFG